ncbi:MAG: hypothetical protein AB1627_13850 [Chloroflexota bacterium]
MRTFVRSIAVLGVTAGLVAACGASAAPTQAPTSAPALAAATATPAPPDPTGTPVATPTTAPPVGPMDPAFVKGSAATGPATSVDDGTTREDGELTVVEGVVIDAINIMLSDARVSGRCTQYLNAIGSTADGVGFQWGTMRIENADGAWEGPWRGAYWDGLQSETDASSWMVGSGAYEGLTFYLHFQGHADVPAELVGVILPAGPPTANP